MVQPLITAVANAATKKVVKQAATKAVKAAAPMIAKAALTSATNTITSTAVRKAINRKKKTTPSRSRRNTRRIAPVAYTTSFAKSGKTVRISQSEIVADLSPDAQKAHWWSSPTPTDFTVLPLAISPSNTDTFPWLSRIAGLFDKFRFRKLNFTFVSTRPTNTRGNVAMGVDFDSYDALPKNIVDMSNLAKFSTSPVYVNQTLNVPVTHPGNKSWYYCDDGSTHGDKKTYNLGTVHIALAGVEDIKSHGYLIVDYDIELCDKNPFSRIVKTIIDDNTATISTVLVDDENTPDQPQVDSTKFYYNDDGVVDPEDNDWFTFRNDGNVRLSNLTIGQELYMSGYFHSPSSGLSTSPTSTPPTAQGLTILDFKTVGDNTKACHMIHAIVTATEAEYSAGVVLNQPQNVSKYIYASTVQS